MDRVHPTLSGPSGLSKLSHAELRLLIDVLVQKQRAISAQEDTVLVLADIASVATLCAVVRQGDLAFTPSAEALQNTRLLSLLLVEALRRLAPLDAAIQRRREQAQAQREARLSKLREARQNKRREARQSSPLNQLNQLNQRIPAPSFHVAERPAAVAFDSIGSVSAEFSYLLSESRELCFMATGTLARAQKAVLAARAVRTSSRQTRSTIRACRTQREHRRGNTGAGTQAREHRREPNTPRCL